MKIEIDNFDGPLDLLLHLVKQKELDIYEINVLEIIEKYLEFIHSMEELNVDIASEYLVMSAELLHLKSKLLLNMEEKEDNFELNSEEDLKLKLIAYEVYKNLTTDFKELEAKRQEVWTKLPENINEYKENQSIITSQLTGIDLLKAFLEAKDRFKKEEKTLTKVTKSSFNIEERIDYIRSKLKAKSTVNFLDLFEDISKDYVIITILSLLEMSKNKEVILRQANCFEPIYVEKK